MIQKASEGMILTNGVSYSYEVDVPEGVVWEEVKLEEVTEELRPGYVTPELEE